jgi:carboxyl-terminal processing protease
MVESRWGWPLAMVLSIGLVGFVGNMPAAAWAQDDEPEISADAEPELSDERLTPTDRDYELFRLFVDTLDQVERNYVEEIDRRVLMEAAIQGLIQKLDPYSNYISPEEIANFRTSIENQFGGIGIQVGMEDGVLTVLSPLVDTPAYRAGIHAGDQIVAIEGEPTKGMSLNDAVTKLKGETGSTVKVTIKPAYVGDPRDVELTREIVHVETVLGDTRNPDDSWNWFLDKDKRIGYIRINSFGRDTYRELRTALRQLKRDGMEGLILDLRFNPGGLLDSAIKVCDLFIEEGVIVSTKGRNVRERTWTANKPGTFSGFPMAILVNRYSASASEVVSGCLQDHGRAVIVGERTWGKGSVQNVIDLEGGRSALKLTTASYHRPSGKDIHRSPDEPEDGEWGVMPDKDYLLMLKPEQLREFVETRRDRDRLIWSEAQAAAEAAGNDPTEAAGPAPDAYIDPQMALAIGYINEKLSEEPATEEAASDEATTTAEATESAAPQS